MTDVDSRAYVFVYMIATSSWNFIALKNSTHECSIRHIEEWNGRYLLCRVLYTKQEAAELIRSAGTSMMSGPDLYCIFDKEKPGQDAIITVWKPPKCDESVEFAVNSSGREVTVLVNLPKFADIKTRCFGFLGLDASNVITNIIDSQIGDYMI